MRKILASMPALLIAISFFLGGVPNFAGQDGTMVLAQDTKNPPPSPPPKKPKKPKKSEPMQPAPRPAPPPGACEATKGQQGPCSCAKRTDGTYRCVGNCCGT
jgi:hypothetical protein